MVVDRHALESELALLAELHPGSDPLLASLSAAIFLEDATDAVFTDSEIRAGLVDRRAVGRALQTQQGS